MSVARGGSMIAYRPCLKQEKGSPLSIKQANRHAVELLEGAETTSWRGMGENKHVAD